MAGVLLRVLPPVLQVLLEKLRRGSLQLDPAHGNLLGAVLARDPFTGDLDHEQPLHLSTAYRAGFLFQKQSNIRSPWYFLILIAYVTYYNSGYLSCQEKYKLYEHRPVFRITFHEQGNLRHENKKGIAYTDKDYILSCNTHSAGYLH